MGSGPFTRRLLGARRFRKEQAENTRNAGGDETPAFRGSLNRYRDFVISLMTLNPTA
jgi:hypothetical protein